MRITLYGTRGSIPIFRPDSAKFGGNTTCLRIHSTCVPKGRALVVDAGSGFLPLSADLLKEGIMGIDLLMTHFHHDHTQGLLLAHHTHMETASFRVWGPEEGGKGPKEVFQQIMHTPHFPVNFERIAHRFKCISIPHVGNDVLIIHKEAGVHLLPIHNFRECCNDGKQLALGRKGKYAVGDCLVVTMHKTVHPEYTVSYRFEERPTGKVFVFLTDHENTASIPRELLRHVEGADLLVQDGQYSEEIYQTRTGGFGHGTPDYCATLAIGGGVKRLGITHHDPLASDTDVLLRIAEAKAKAVVLGHEKFSKDIFGCACYDTIEV